MWVNKSGFPENRTNRLAIYEYVYMDGYRYMERHYWEGSAHARTEAKSCNLPSASGWPGKARGMLPVLKAQEPGVLMCEGTRRRPVQAESGLFVLRPSLGWGTCTHIGGGDLPC